jgi:hypothetical protein
MLCATIEQRDRCITLERTLTYFPDASHSIHAANHFY